MSDNAKNWTIIASLAGCSALVMGAVGAHAVHDAGASALIDHASLYQLIHAVVLLHLAEKKHIYSSIARWLFLAGILLFCGSLYAKALFGWTLIVHAAPFGGISLMTAWIFLALSVHQSTKNKSHES